jgi:phage/plasmid-like protein (TIGR03299 family)
MDTSNHAQLDFSTGQAAIALVGGGKSAWHGHGQEILATDTIEDIQRKAGLDWNVKRAPCTFTDATGKLHEVPDTMVNYRSDTLAALGVTSGSKYNVVQPGEVLEFFKDFLADQKMTMETAGALKGGKIVWALSKLGKDFDFLLPGKDKLEGYFRLQTSFDTTRATDGVGTYVRQVCINTSEMVNRDADARGYRTPHSAIFDAKALKLAMGMFGEQHKVTAQFYNALVKRKVNEKERREFFCDLFGLEVADLTKKVDGKDVVGRGTRRYIEQLEAAFANGPGAGLKSAKDTAFGLFNAVTYWTDHESVAISRNGESKDKARLASSWFGLGSRTKNDAQILLARLADCEELLVAA